MKENRLIISPKTKIGELLEAYPRLEKALIGMSPVFEKLKNPVLRKTVARVATLQQVSVVGGIPVEDIVNRLREEIGQAGDTIDESSASVKSSPQPNWFDEKSITIKFDATPIINSGESPLAEIFRKSNSLKKGEIFELKTPFVPAPILDMLKNKDYTTWTIQKESAVFSYITRLEED